MSYMVEVVNVKTREVIKRLGPMSERKADRVTSGLLINLSDDYFVQSVQVTKGLDLDDTL
jgi:hypothetical protein